MLNAESGEEERLHSTPEARLWLTVMLRTAAQLKDSAEWLSRSLEREAPRQVQMHLRRVRDAEQFFFGRDSTFGEICELLGYDEAEHRSRVAAWLSERAGVFRRAEAYVGASGIRKPTGRPEPSWGERADPQPGLGLD